jgi:hypothetical protein
MESTCGSNHCELNCRRTPRSRGTGPHGCLHRVAVVLPPESSCLWLDPRLGRQSGPPGRVEPPQFGCGRAVGTGISLSANRSRVAIMSAGILGPKPASICAAQASSISLPKRSGPGKASSSAGNLPESITPRGLRSRRICRAPRADRPALPSALPGNRRSIALTRAARSKFRSTPDRTCSRRCHRDGELTSSAFLEQESDFAEVRLPISPRRQAGGGERPNHLLCTVRRGPGKTRTNVHSGSRSPSLSPTVMTM